MGDPYNLRRFVAAQDPVYTQVCAELRSGRKTGHWMWFIFPQIAGLGSSRTAQEFAISSRAEAEAYLAHPVLGPRLRECTRLVAAVEGRTLDEILGYPDNLKFRSSMTLFIKVTDDNEVFMGALRKFCSGEFDRRTVQRL